MHPSILVERHGQAATVVLNRPGKLNAFDLAMWRALRDAFVALDADPSVRCVVVRGADARSFSSGADIQEFPSLRNSPQQALQYAQDSNGALRAVADCRHPTVAMIAGVCVGGGLELATMCDLRIAARSSRFGIPVSRLGLTMNHCELAGLLRTVGRSVALEILFEGRVFDAQEALDKRLLNRVVDDAELEADIARTVQRICAGGPLAARWHKKFADQLLAVPQPSPQELAEGYACFDTADYRAGYQAFLAKATPAFAGH